MSTQSNVPPSDERKVSDEEITIAVSKQGLKDLVEVLKDPEVSFRECVWDHYEGHPSSHSRIKRALLTLDLLIRRSRG